MKKIFAISLFIFSFCRLHSQQYEQLFRKVVRHKILPVAGYNMYDGFQLGAVIHNYEIPKKDFTGYLAPAFAVGSKRITGYAGLDYKAGNISIGVNGGSFSKNEGNDALGKKIVENVYRIAPYVKYKFLEWKTFVIGESDFDYALNQSDSFYYPQKRPTRWRYLNQLSVGTESFRKLFPYDLQLQVQQARDFYRVNFNAHYFFNYWREGGVQARLFAAKFGYLGQKTEAKRFSTLRYQPKLTAVTGHEDYTYSNYFIGRNEFSGFASQQIMMRDGGLKLRTDIFQDLQGRSDDWVASLNLNTTLPLKNFPLRLFLDIGTYSGLWNKQSVEPRFLYVAGLQVSLFRNMINIYAPLLYSSKFRDNLSTVPEENKFFRKVSFSFDVHRFHIKRFL